MSGALRRPSEADFVETEARVFTYTGDPHGEYSHEFLARIAEQEEIGYELRSIRWVGDSPVLVFMRGATESAPRRIAL